MEETGGDWGQGETEERVSLEEPGRLEETGIETTGYHHHARGEYCPQVQRDQDG